MIIKVTVPGALSCTVHMISIAAMPGTLSYTEHTIRIAEVPMTLSCTVYSILYIIRIVEIQYQGSCTIYMIKIVIVPGILLYNIRVYYQNRSSTRDPILYSTVPVNIRIAAVPVPILYSTF
jgi:hypothetical protein